MNREELRLLILGSLRRQGFRTRGGRIVPPKLADKNHLRNLHGTAVQHKLERATPGLRRHEPQLLTRLAAGHMVNPEYIQPRLVEVQPDSDEELLFRYVALHWSIPVSSGYGRRLRFLVVDEQNGKLIGVIGLGDPVFNLSVRDKWIGWDRKAQRIHLQNVMDAFILGAVPPYASLLCGKLVAMLVGTAEVRDVFRKKYGAHRSLIRRQTSDARLAMVTTMSALGRSSLYNRMRYRDRMFFQSVGFSQGSGEFHFSNGLYGAIRGYADRYCVPTAKKERWGAGFRNRREVIRKCLLKIGLPEDLLYHGVKREVFVVPLARNTREFLRGEQSGLQYFGDGVNDVFAWFRERWLIPRATRGTPFGDFNPSSYRLWPEGF